MGAKRSHAAIRDRVHEADLQPLSTVTVDQLAVDGRTASTNDDDHWLDGAVDPEQTDSNPYYTVGCNRLPVIRRAGESRK